MFVNCFTVTMASQFYKTTLKKITNDFGKNIPKSSPYEGGPLGFISHLFCVDANVNVEDICKKNNCKMMKPYKIEIEEHMYNDKYIIRDTYNKEGPPFRLELDQLEYLRSIVKV
jgi:hypothetical protein